MTALFLTPAARKTHRAAAHHLLPVVAIGNDGLTENRPGLCKQQGGHDDDHHGGDDHDGHHGHDHGHGHGHDD